jgi:hypothetical protein
MNIKEGIIKEPDLLGFAFLGLSLMFGILDYDLLASLFVSVGFSIFTLSAFFCDKSRITRANMSKTQKTNLSVSLLLSFIFSCIYLNTNNFIWYVFSLMMFCLAILFNLPKPKSQGPKEMSFQ